jgi:signal transduction histidine kinase
VASVIEWTRRWSCDPYVAPRESPGKFPGRLIALGFVVSGVVTGKERFAWSGIGLAVALLTIVCAIAWIFWSAGVYLFPERLGNRPVTVALGVLGLCGAALTGIDGRSVAVSFPIIASMSVGMRYRSGRSAAAVAVMGFVLAMSAWLSGNAVGAALGYVSVLFGIYGLALGRRAQILRADTAERLLSETRRANSEEAHAAALAERSRIAREIHDVLAHSLAALSVQLEAADALLTGGTDPAKAHDYVVKARRMAREGLTETRRAIAALREDAPPLRTLLHQLADSYQADTGAPVTVAAACEPVGLPADAALALYRTAQESLTNTRKHAPNAPVDIVLICDDAEVELTIANGAATAPPTALAASGGGYGLAGLRERAELAGGALEAGPQDGCGWRVRLRIPLPAAADLVPASTLEA